MTRVETDRKPAAVLAVAVVVWVGIYGTLTYLRHRYFGTFGFDLGIYDQGIWLLSQGSHDVITVRGLPLLGHHLNLALVGYVPFYWLGAGPQFLNLTQAVSLGLGAVPVFLLARDRLGDAWAAVGLAVAYLAHPTTGFLQVETFHPDTMGILPLLVAWWAAHRKRWGWFFVAAGLAVAWKEDLALAVAVLGVVVALRGERRLGWGVAALATGWFVAATGVVIPLLNGRGVFYGQFFGDLGDDPLQVGLTLLSDPTALLSRLTARDTLTYLWSISAPYGFTFLAGPAGTAVALPQLVVNLISEFPYTRDYRVHYSAVVLAGATLGMVEGVGWLARRLGDRRLLALAVLYTAVATTVQWGPLTLAPQHRVWPGRLPWSDALAEAVASIPPDGAVSATYLAVPHLTHRRLIYEFPNPWKVVNWGFRDELPPDPTPVRWLVVIPELHGSEDRSLYEELRNARGAEVVFERDGVVVVHLGEPVSRQDLGSIS